MKVIELNKFTYSQLGQAFEKKNQLKAKEKNKLML